MTQGLITEQYVKDIAEAIRFKNNENRSYYPSEMAEAIMNIPTGGGGLDLVTSLSLNVDKTVTYDKNVIATATLMADYDDLTPTDIDLKGYLKNATVLFYDSNNNLLGTAITNEDGVAICNLVLNETTTIHCVFNGTSDYNSCISNEITVIIKRYLYMPLFDGSEEIHSIGVNSWVVDTILHRGGGTNQIGLLSDGWDNTIDWELTVTATNGRWSGGLWLSTNLPTNGWDNAEYGIFLSDGSLILYKLNPNDQIKISNVYRPNSTQNFKFIKNNNELEIYVDDVYKNTLDISILQSEKMYIGTVGWDNYGTHYISDVMVKEI